MEGVSVVAAVFNEGDNISTFMLLLDSVNDVNELVVVDDGSTDSTIENISKFHPHYSIKIIQRGTKMGTVSAQIAGAKQASYDYVVIMDADLQHDPSLIEKMHLEIANGYDLIIASRMVDGGASKREPLRGLISRGANILAHLFIPQTRMVRDVMSGYFMTRKEIVSGLAQINDSYKLLLYIFAAKRGIRYLEVPYKFLPRKEGKSKVVSRFNFLLRFVVELMHYVKVENNADG